MTSLDYYAICHTTRIRALGTWLRANLPVVLLDAPSDDYDMGCDLDHWARQARCFIDRSCIDTTRGHYRLVRLDDRNIISHFMWTFNPMPDTELTHETNS